MFNKKSTGNGFSGGLSEKTKRKAPQHAAVRISPISKKKYLAVLGISLALLMCTFFVAMGFGFSSYVAKPQTDAPVASEEPEITDDLLVPVDKATGKINILVLGVDVEGLRTDTMIVASYDLDENKINLLSIPRDTRMYIGKKYQKINAAHAITQSGHIKGPQGSIEAVTRLTGIPINYYVEFNFSAFRNTIDSLGGVYFDVPRDMNYEDPVQGLYIHLKQGYQLLDGDKSEQLVRFRRYAMGDLERVEMQQKFISAVLEQKLKPETLKNLPALFQQWQQDINTNLSITDIAKFLPNLSDLSSENITMFSVPGHYNDTDYGASYWIVNMKELAELIKTEFNYDASKITIHSADGSSASKDVKQSSKSESSDKSSSKKETSAPVRKTSEPTAAPTSNSTHNESSASQTTQKTTPALSGESDNSSSVRATVRPAAPQHTTAPIPESVSDRNKGETNQSEQHSPAQNNTPEKPSDSTVTTSSENSSESNSANTVPEKTTNETKSEPDIPLLNKNTDASSVSSESSESEPAPKDNDRTVINLDE